MKKLLIERDHTSAIDIFYIQDIMTEKDIILYDFSKMYQGKLGDSFFLDLHLKKHKKEQKIYSFLWVKVCSNKNSIAKIKKRIIV